MKKSPYSPLSQIRESYSRQTLSIRFAIIGGPVMLAAAIIMAAWVSNRIEMGVVANTASATALYMESVVSPASQELARSDTLSPGAVRALTEILNETPIKEHVVSYKIWKPGGLIAYASNPDLIGKSFRPGDDLRAAWSGKVIASFSELDDQEAAAERAMNLSLLEVYSPIRETWSGKVIAVAEFYEIADSLERELLQSRISTWVMVALIMTLAALLLFGIVRNGSRTIAKQQQTLTDRVSQLASLVEQNRELRQRVQRASARAAEMNERYLRRISADLHDGPAQLLSLSALRLDSVADAEERGERKRLAATLRSSLDQAMADIRSICRGLTLPEIDSQETETVIRRAVTDHETRSGDIVSVDTDNLNSFKLDHSYKICLFRFLQEALSNASRHGKGKDIRVAASGKAQKLVVSVSDGGPGLCATQAGKSDKKGLGLEGLRNRIESQGGQLEIESKPGKGTRLQLVFDLQGEDFR